MMLTLLTCHPTIRNCRLEDASSMPSDPENKGRVFSIARASGEDGPGIRTTVFLKGCQLRCIWCHSPQSQGSEEPRLTFYESRCIRCGACVEACSKALHRLDAEERKIIVEVKKQAATPSDAHQLKRYRDYFEQSGEKYRGILVSAHTPDKVLQYLQQQNLEAVCVPWQEIFPTIKRPRKLTLDKWLDNDEKSKENNSS